MDYAIAPTKPKKVIKPIKKLLKLKVFSAFFPEESAENYSQPSQIFLRLDRIPNQQSKPFNIQDLISDLTNFVPVADFEPNVTFVKKKPSTPEIILVVPKTFTYGDAKPRPVEYSEYTASFHCYKLDPKELVDYLKKMVYNTQVLTIESLRKALLLAGLPIKSQEEKERYLQKYQVEEDKRRKMEVEKERLKSEKKAENEERAKRNEQKMGEIFRESQEKTDKLKEKHRWIDFRIKARKAQRAEEKQRVQTARTDKKVKHEVKRRKYSEGEIGISSIDIVEELVYDLVDDILGIRKTGREPRSAKKNKRTLRAKKGKKSSSVSHHTPKEKDTPPEPLSNFINEEVPIPEPLPEVVNVPSPEPLSSPAIPLTPPSQKNPSRADAEAQSDPGYTEIENEFKQEDENLQDSPRKKERIITEEEIDLLKREVIRRKNTKLDAKLEPIDEAAENIAIENEAQIDNVEEEPPEQIKVEPEKSKVQKGNKNSKKKEVKTGHKKGPPSTEKLLATTSRKGKRKNPVSKVKANGGSTKDLHVNIYLPEEKKDTETVDNGKSDDVLSEHKSGASSPRSPKAKERAILDKKAKLILERLARKGIYERIVSRRASGQNMDFYQTPDKSPSRPLQTDRGLDTVHRKPFTATSRKSTEKQHIEASPEPPPEEPKPEFHFEYDDSEALLMELALPSSSQKSGTEKPPPVKPSFRTNAFLKALQFTNDANRALTTMRKGHNKDEKSTSRPRGLASEKLLRMVSRMPTMKEKDGLSPEEEKFLQEYMEMLNKQQKEEEERLAQTQEDKEEEKEPESSFDSTEEIDLFATFMNQSAEQVQKKLRNPKRMAVIISSLKQNEELKNIVMQRTLDDLNSMQGCNSILGTFFNEREFPMFYKSKLGASKFTPNVELTQGFAKEMGERLRWDKSEAINLGSTDLDKMESQKDELKETIVAHDLYGKIAKNNKLMNMLMRQSTKEYEELLKEVESQPLPLDEKLGLLKSHAALAARIIRARQKELNKVNGGLEIIASPRYMTETGQTKVKKVVRVKKNVQRKYKVNVGIIQKRNQMSKFEMLERRYNALSGFNSQPNM
eukprot:TRINITY_DN307_c0_g1_i1.p3 TRINITY_DN307_c0_g1~~TRINITY_DN307_c0_g1_i1.p3  ORF type:complete len:1074 (+),score=171.78 TRINITY_DN307_c0_g1_i1:6030-9251(+)